MYRVAEIIGNVRGSTVGRDGDLRGKRVAGVLSKGVRQRRLRDKRAARIEVENVDRAGRRVRREHDRLRGIPRIVCCRTPIKNDADGF